MNYLFFLSTLLLTLNVNAKDMSQTEIYNDVYKTLENGSIQYTGACSVHQDFTNIHFLKKESLVHYIDLSDDLMTRQEFLEATSTLEIDIINAAGLHIGFELPRGIDDFSADKIENNKIHGLNLYRLNIGIGGGNGMYLIYNRIMKNSSATYELMAEIFDGEVKFCDSSVWLFK